jgi:hypothetical protein
VSLKPSRTIAHPGDHVRIAILNGSPHGIVYGPSCFELERRVGAHWQAITHTHGVVIVCAASALVQPPHSRANQTLYLYDDLRPGRYRVTFGYRDSPGSARQRELVASTYLTVVSPAVGKGTVTGRILFGGGDPLTNQRRSIAGVVAVFDQVRGALSPACHRCRLESRPQTPRRRDV